MSIMIPELSERQLKELPSHAEEKVYRALRDKLSVDYVVLFQVGWILQREERQASDGETDFLICHPEQGYLCVEVKGGGISFDANHGEWFSIDRNSTQHQIKNPVSQALNAKYSIRKKLQEHPKWRKQSFRDVLMGHAVFFPDLNGSKPLQRADLPEIIIGTCHALTSPQQWVENVFSYWRNDNEKCTPIGRHGIDIVKDVFARSFFITPAVSIQLAEQELQRLKLTTDQLRILDFLRSHRRVAVSGGAGTGKTILALEKARRLASEGFKTLLTCYNRQLADYLAMKCLDLPNLDVMSFHQLCHKQVDLANRNSGRDLLMEAKATYPGKGLFDVQLPNALSYTIDELPDRYDAIVCDEGQDFREDFWVPLELLLSDFGNSPLYVFYDDNQNIYSRAGSFPITEQPFTLTTNCRNTTPIHLAAYRHYQGVPVNPPTVDGDKVHFEVSPNPRTQAQKICNRIVELVVRQNVSPEDIAVLITDAKCKSEFYAELRSQPLSRPAQWLFEGQYSQNCVRVDTVQRFKGLESQIVILWGLDNIDLSIKTELMYVGMSRAKSLLVIIGNASTCAAIGRLD